MKYRKLRIAWSVAWGVVAVSLCMLWVRSHWQQVGIYRVYGNTGMSLYLASNDGIVLIPTESHRLFQRSAAPTGWKLRQCTVYPMSYSWRRVHGDYYVIPYFVPVSIATAVVVAP